MIMTAPVLVLGALTVFGGWLNLPALLPLGPVGLLEHWLEPVTGSSAARLAGATHLDHGTETILVGVATTVAVVGIIFALLRYRKPITDKAHSPVDDSVLARAYHVDGLVNALVVRPISAFANVVLTRGVETGVDRAFSAGGSMLSRTAALLGSKLQDGDVGKYAWLLAAGALALLAALTLS
jgi:NADH-quinone oxidoreductase subunit L